MTARDVIAEMRGRQLGGVASEETLRAWADRLESTLAQPSGEAVALWRLLDDIDTLDDACKGNDAEFRRRCYSIQRKRFGIVSGERIDLHPATTPPAPAAGGLTEGETEAPLFPEDDGESPPFAMPRTEAMLRRIDARQMLKAMAEDCRDDGDAEMAAGFEKVLAAVERLICAADRAYPNADYSEDMHGFEVRMALIQIGAAK